MFIGAHRLNAEHHSAIFVAEEVTVEDVGAGELFELLTNHRDAVRRMCFVDVGKRKAVHPDIRRLQRFSRIAAQLERIRMDVKNVEWRSVVVLVLRERPLFAAIERLRNVGDIG